LTRRGANAVYYIIPKFWEWLTINCAVNATPNFYMYRSEKLKDDYIKIYKPNIYMVMKIKHG
jgi:hypothetical protein